MKNEFEVDVLKNDFPQLVSTVVNHSTFSKIASFDEVAPGAIVFAPKDKDLAQALLNRNAVIVTSESAARKIKPEDLGERSMVASKNPGLLMALTAQKYFDTNPYEQSRLDQTHSVHPSASVHPTAVIDPSAILEPNVVIKSNVIIGARAWIGAGTVIEKDCVVGSGSLIHPLVYLGPRTHVGSACEIKPHSTIGSAGYGFAHDHHGKHFAIPQMGRVFLEDRVQIGANCTIDRATFHETRIKSGTKLDNLIHIAHNCTIGHDCLLAGGVMIAGSTQLGDRVMSGGRATITDHISIASDVQIGGLAGVSHDLTESGAYSGFPIQPLKDSLRTSAALKGLADMKRLLSKIAKQLGIEEKRS